ncbi:hypothetical protein DFA_06406 [Cavenderia fasciculata]|uniref:Uncharacterized protein n=1 Tax=Cavenderia fasciculata TaxID=261658 RepID=F4PIX0_CACFS|nr:uncharacterized protein DFA_06406 [Cavenderia fasciculata]EGG24256.1 hypothetical protein DFA_06406 [Cavenderia fasciculata]|eukprot:XP_004362107.1 hypothetical protein DFA_06406 [Cavenderia fasciculata]
MESLSTVKIDGQYVSLSKYIQSMIIDKVVHGHDFKDRQYYDGFRSITPQEILYLMIHTRPLEKQNKFIIFKQLGSIALVSKWWMKVVQQIVTSTPSSIKIVGLFKESYFTDTSSSSSITYLKWKIINDYRTSPNYKEFDYSRLPLLLPNLKSIDIVGIDLNKKVTQAIVQVINLFPHIQVNLDITVHNGGGLKWPDNIYFQGLVPKVVITHSNNLYYYEDIYNIEYSIKMLDDLKPNYVNIGFDDGGHDGGSIHYNYPTLFNHLTTSSHINIEYDFVELNILKYIINSDNYNIQSLKVGIITCPLENEPFQAPSRGRAQHYTYQNGCRDCYRQELGKRETLRDWDELCTNLSNNSILKKLWLENPHGNEREEEEEEESEEINTKKSMTWERIISSFASIWDANETIELLSLSNHPNIISPVFFSFICHNQTITTLILIDGTLIEEYIPSFSLLLVTNQTITALDINNNQLQPSTELNTTLKQNKSIKVLNIADNYFTFDLFDSLLESDSIEYLIIDQELSKDYHQHRYFNQSKSMIECFCIEAGNKPFDFYFNRHLLLD